jgi:lipoprotein NlpD
MVKVTATRWVVFGVLLGTLAGCGRMLPMGGRDELIKYTVQKSETLYSISWRYGYDHREVAAWNHIKPPYNIYPGQQILLIAPHQMDAKSHRNVAAVPAASSSSTSISRSPAATPPVVASATISKPRNTPTKKMLEKAQANRHLKGIAWRWPSQGVVVSGFNPDQGKKGVDIRGKLGQSVIAAASGNVVYSGSGLIGYGNLVIIKHNDTYLSAYAHNRQLLVKEGADVKQGEKIAEMGDSGKEGVILHFEIRRDGKPVNPLTYLPKGRN